MKVKSSTVLEGALRLINSGEQRYACAAIIDVETSIRWANDGDNVVSKAMPIFKTFMPQDVPKASASCQAWWPKGDPGRPKALEDAIALALSKGD